MRPIEAALLFVTRTPLSMEGYCRRLNKALAPEGIEFWPVLESGPAATVLQANGFRLTIQARMKPLPGDQFLDALDCLLSEPFRGPLSDVLHRHERNITVTLLPMPGEGVHLSPQERVRALRIAHRATALIVELHHPAAVHWRPSNQLLLGSQYLNIVSEQEPWALFARAVATGQMQLQVDPPEGLEGQPIIVSPNGFDMAEAYAAGLSFLRHQVLTGERIPEGHSFGPVRNASAKVTYMPTPDGTGELAHLGLTDTPFFVSKRSERPERPVSTAQTISALQSALRRRPQDASGPESRGHVLGAMATMAVPPLGVILVASHHLLGGTIAKSLLMMTGSFVLALGFATYLDARQASIAANAMPEIVTQDSLTEDYSE